MKQKVLNDKQAEEEYLKLVAAISRSTTVDPADTQEAIDARKKRLEAPGNHEEWIKYYFPKFSFADPAPFQTASTQRLIDAVNRANKRGFGKYFQSRKWARGLAKSTRRMMETFYVHYAMHMPINGLIISKTEKNATKLLTPYRANLEGNDRLIQDYGKQINLGAWQANMFVSKSMMAFSAIGAEQNPRGARVEEMRINWIDFDDTDDDELSRNPDRIDDRWKWITRAVIPTVEISRPYFAFFDNNVIAEDCLALRFSEIATDEETVNIRDEEGNSTWPQKNTEEIIDEMFNGYEYSDIQAEFYNNPTSTGKTFPEITWGECPPLETMQSVVVYSDPAPSNKDMPAQKAGLTNSRKSTWIVGKKDTKYYIYYGFLDVMSNDRFVAGIYACRDYIGDKTPAFFYIENNSLQQPFYEQVLIPLNLKQGKGTPRGVIGIMPDERKKPDKWTRIEAGLQGTNINGFLVFNIAEKENPHMKRLVAQFLAAKPTSRELDGPDSIEGAKWIIDQKNITKTSFPTIIKRNRNKKRF